MSSDCPHVVCPECNSFMIITMRDAAYCKDCSAIIWRSDRYIMLDKIDREIDIFFDHALAEV